MSPFVSGLVLAGGADWRAIGFPQLPRHSEVLRTH